MASANPFPPERAEQFEANRGRLWHVAYRMLGSRAEADDVVQETYLRWHRARLEEIRTPQAWLVTAATRLAIDRLRQLRTEREHYKGPWLPEPIVAAAPSPVDQAELASELSVAFLAVLERLAPEERAAFLLHEVFDTGYAEIAALLGRTEPACRQMVSRARKRVRAERPRARSSLPPDSRLLQDFVQALRAHDARALLGLLAAEATWTSDGGGKALAALRVITGAEQVARFATGVFRKLIHAIEFRPVMVNGEAGFALLHQGELFSVMAIRTDGARILSVSNVMNPDKLRHVRLPER
jgi:RNA polymerase sigma-70 factor (ECF subfamily)